MRTRAGYQDRVSSKQRASGLNLVSSIALYKQSSAYIDAIKLGFTNGHKAVLGSPDAELAGTLVASVAFAPDDKVEALYVWTDSSLMRVQGVVIKLASGRLLDGGQGRLPTKASLRLDQPGDLGSGLLLGVTGAAQPVTEVLSAVGFAFLKSPVSAAMAVYMPEIRIDSVRFKPENVVTYENTFTSSSGGVSKGACPVLTKKTTVTVSNTYAQTSEVQRLKKIFDGLGGPQDATASFTLEADLVASQPRVLDTGDTVTDTWNSEVRSGVGACPCACLFTPHRLAKSCSLD